MRIVITHAKKALDVTYGFGNRPLSNHIDLLGIRLNSCSRYFVAKVIDTLEAKTALGPFQIHRILIEPLQYAAEVLFMFLHGFTEDQNVIEVYHAKSIKPSAQHPIHHVLKVGRHIHESKRDYSVFKQAPSACKSSIVLMSLSNTKLVISSAHV